VKVHHKADHGLSVKLNKCGFYNSEEMLNIEGPIGKGLGLKVGDKGKHIAIIAGTGLIPFLDLLDYLLTKSMYEVLANKLGLTPIEATNLSSSPNRNTAFD